VYQRIKSAGVSMPMQCMSVLLNDFVTRTHVRNADPRYAAAWDICLRYFLHKAEGLDLPARDFIFDCLRCESRSTELAAIYCVFYEEGMAELSTRSALARMLIHIFRRIGLMDLLAEATRGVTTARSKEINHLAEVITRCVRISPRDSRIIFDFAEFTSVMLSFIGMSCAVDDVVESMRKVYSIAGNDLLASIQEPDERGLLADLLRRGGTLEIIASL
jgi:transcriptional regulator of met regulon